VNIMSDCILTTVTIGILTILNKHTSNMYAVELCMIGILLIHEQQ
jgi:hypothetical protein